MDSGVNYLCSSFEYTNFHNAKVKSYFDYCLDLRFEEEPKYAFLRKLFKMSGKIDWSDKDMEIKKIKPKDKISDSGVDTPGTSL